MTDPKDQYLRDLGWELRWGYWIKGSTSIPDDTVETMTLDELKFRITPVKGMTV